MNIVDLIVKGAKKILPENPISYKMRILTEAKQKHIVFQREAKKRGGADRVVNGGVGKDISMIHIDEVLSLFPDKSRAFILNILRELVEKKYLQPAIFHETNRDLNFHEQVQNKRMQYYITSRGLSPVFTFFHENLLTALSLVVSVIALIIAII